MIIFSCINAQNTLFQLPNLKNYIVWGSNCILGDKKAQNESSRALHAAWLISLNAATVKGCDKKSNNNKGGMPVTELLNTSTR